MNVSKFAKNNIALCIGTFGLAIVGYMGYHAVRKCCLGSKVHAATQNRVWWEKVTETKDFTRFKKNWKYLAKSDVARQWESAKLRKTYYSKHRPSTGYQAPLGTVYGVPANFSLWMPGVALVASYLAEKKQIEGLFVCETLEALSKKIQEIHLNPNDQKAAFVAGTFSSGFKNEFSFGFEPNFPQHKVAVLVEKKEGKLSIALLDSQPVKTNKRIDPEHLQKELWEGYDQWDKFNSQELAFRAILKGSKDARLLYSQVPIQRSFGCETFALKNSIAFLKDPHFFNKITTSVETPNIEVIEQLPSEYMIGTQSTQTLAQFKKKGGEFHKNLLGKNKTLQNYLDTHCIKGEDRKVQNHYITKKSFKYLKFATLSMDKLKAPEIQAIINKTLIK